MEVNLKSLLALRAVMTEGTVTGAAQRLHRTQSAVSRMIAQLEASAGFPLFRRERQRLVPTAQGMAFYRETERAIAAFAEVETNAKHIRESRPAPLRILAQSHIAHGLLNEALATYCSRHPEFQFAIEIRQREYISHWIANRQFDIGFAPAPVEHPLLESEPLIRTPVFVLLASAHPLTRKARLAPADILHEPLIAVRPGIPMRTRLDALFSTHNATPAIRGETASVLSACQLAARGLGLTFADPFVASLFLDDRSVAIRALKFDLPVDYVVLRRSGDEHDCDTDEFVDHVRATSRELLKRVEQRAGSGRR